MNQNLVGIIEMAKKMDERITIKGDGASLEEGILTLKR